MKRFKFISTILILFAINQLAHSQNLEHKIQNEKKKIKDLFLKDLSWKNTPDSTMIIGFSFKIRVEQNENNLIQIISITANDSIAYKLFPKYHSLKKIDYRLFMREKKKADFIIPVLIEIVGHYQEDYNTSENLLKFYKENIFRREMFKEIRNMLHIDPLGDNTRTEEYIYFEPVFIWMDKRNKK